MRRQAAIHTRVGLTAALVLCGLVGCGPGTGPATPTVSDKRAAAAEDFESARKGFVTKLRVRGPAPQRYRNVQPPAGVKLVKFKSGNLTLKGWLSEDAGDRKKQPAVVYLHGGWSFDADDWEDAEPFAKAGFLLFMPMLRGENGNPGIYESFLGEVDDAIAAGRFVSDPAERR